MTIGYLLYYTSAMEIASTAAQSVPDTFLNSHHSQINKANASSEMPSISDRSIMLISTLKHLIQVPLIVKPHARDHPSNPLVTRSNHLVTHELHTRLCQMIS
ncbi:hypothetical protein DM02DRAFT_57604 [Periconia macrospinosa]|uniref:Uncharacterized protein n=1 Tax=Periconia macrospinosa TaxID=97972 RepID=A0A2V1E658_9PLEO|nr:hypothetical protein DM02DRAFT_57604 [Periconia macrospinosa]